MCSDTFVSESLAHIFTDKYFYAKVNILHIFSVFFDFSRFSRRVISIYTKIHKKEYDIAKRIERRELTPDEEICCCIEEGSISYGRPWVNV